VLEDGEIIRRCLGGQTGMMDLLIDRYKTDLYSLCVKLTRNGPDADDLFQDTWVKVMKSLKSYKPEHRFRTWLFAICTNRYRDLYRWRRRWWHRVTSLGQDRGAEEDPRPQDELAYMEFDGPTPEEHTIAQEGRGAVKEALDRLEDTFRLPILLHYFQDLSVAEIAMVMEIPEGTVKTRLSRGREKLRGALESTHER
jgi:RNA polymerase sigma-70 factor (ECF subfamily)